MLENLISNLNFRWQIKQVSLENLSIQTQSAEKQPKVSTSDKKYARITVLISV